MFFFPKVLRWVNENVEQLHHNFIKSKPTKARIRDIHRWANPLLLKKSLKDEKYNEISVEKFRLALLNFAEKKINNHRIQIRQRSMKEINHKVLQNPNYADKLTYLDQNIESVMREFSMRDCQN